jgi:adenylate cyclase
MACIGCGFDLSPGFAFCPRCGRRQPMHCSSCGFACETDFAFCPGCGVPRQPGIAAEAQRPGVPNVEGQADRRQVTILFADVAGFTGFAERLDPEEVREFQNTLFAMMHEMIVRYGGFVEKFVGDAVMAVFGAPVAHEDDPERALHAALGIVEGCARLSDTWRQRFGRPISLHVGVHTGPVVAGSLGSSAGAAYAVTGDTVNATARILAAATDAILVSEATYALARHSFAFEPPREIELRGRSEPIVIYRLLGSLSLPRSARGLAGHGLSAPMVGRSDEFDQLLTLFKRMQRGRAQLVSLVGDAGSGKSRLITEFLEQLQETGSLGGTIVRRAMCSSLGEPTYGVFASMCRESYQVDPGDSFDVARQKLAAGLQALGAQAEVAAAIAPVLNYLVGVDAKPSVDFEAEQLKRQITLAARELVERRLQQGPVLVIVEDLHWADAASVELFCDVVDHLADCPLMMLFSHRPDVRSPVVGRAAQSIIRLAPLSLDETRALVSRIFGRVEGDAFARVQRFVATRAGGNPLFVEEMVRNLVNKKVFIRRDDCWTCPDACEDIDVPPTLHGLLLSRVDALPPATQRLLQEAAVLGPTFEETLLLDIASDSASGKESAAETLDRLMQFDLIAQVGRSREGRQYRFTHALVHEAVYQSILLSRRTTLHERVGCALERIAGVHPARATDLEALGHHWSLSTDKPRGARYVVAAGDRAKNIYANDDAMRHYERALRILAACEHCDSLVATVRERLADVLALTGRRTEALALYDLVRTYLQKVADPAKGARLLRKIGALHWEAGDRARASDCFTMGLDLLQEDPNSVERARLFQEIGRLAFGAGDNRSAIAWAERALAVTTSEDASNADGEQAREIAATRAHAHNTLGVALARTGRPQEAVKQIEQSIALAEMHDLLQVACRGYTNLGVLYSALNPSRSIDTCLHGLETAKKVGDLGLQSRLYANLAVSYCALTDRCGVEGLEAARTAIDLDRRLELFDHLAVPLIVLGQIHQCHGDRALALAAYKEALSLAERAGEPQLLFPCYDGLATLYLDSGDQASAELFLTKSAEICERAGIEPDALMVLPFFC